MLRLVERGRKTGYAGSGDNIISWNFGSIPLNAFGSPRLSDSLGEVYHEYTVYAENAVERYDTGCQHTLTNFRQEHIWRGVNSFGLPVEIVEDTTADSYWWNTGSEQLFRCGISLYGYHTVDEATILGDPVQFPSEHNGSWSASLTDGYATVTATLTVTGGTGTAHVSTTSMPGYPLAAYAAGYIHAYAVGRASWRVVFKPIYPDGAPVTGKEALVVLGDVESTGYNASAHMDRVATLVHERTAPIDEVFELPIESVKTRVHRSCGAVWFESTGGGLVTHYDTAVEDGGPLHPYGILWDAAVWSRRTSCAVVWSRKAFGQTPSSVLDDLGSSQAVSYGFAHESRWCQHRYHDAAGVTHVRRASLHLPSLKDFVLFPWHYNSGGTHDLPDDLLEAPSGSSREFWSNLGNPNDYGTAHEFRPYRFMELEVESETVQSQTFTLQWNLGVGGTYYGTKSWVAGIARGKQTLRIDLRDPDLVNGVPVESIEQLDQWNPASSFYMPASSVMHTHRFGGMGAVNSLRVWLPAGAKLRVSKLRLICEEATIEHWRGNTPVGGLVDDADHLRVNGNGTTVFATSSAWDARRGLDAMGIQVTGEDWALGSGWLHQIYGSASIVDKAFNPVPAGNLLATCPLYSTHLGSDFRGYWGMSQEQPVGTSPVVVEVESLFGHRLTATAVPALDSGLTVVWPPAADRDVQTDKEGKGRLNERQMSLDFPPVNPRIYCPRHPVPREEETITWSFSRGMWSGIAFSPRGAARRPSRDVNAAQRHVRATSNDGFLTTSKRDNTVSGEWQGTTHNERSQGASLRIERASVDQRVHLVNERSKVLTQFRTRLDGQDIEPIKTIGSGEYPAMTVLPGNRTATYWIAGEKILGQVADRDGTVLRGPEIVEEDVLPVGVGTETSVGRAGLVGTLLTYQKDGFTKVVLCRDALTPEPVLSVEAGDMPEILGLRDGRRFLYWSPEATGNVRALVLDGRGQVIRPIQTVVTDLDPYTGISVREALGPGGARRVWMSAVRDGENIELTSVDGLTWS